MGGDALHDLDAVLAPQAPKVNPLRVYPPVREGSPNKAENNAHTMAKHAAFALLVENGADVRTAAETLGYSTASAYRLKQKLAVTPNAYEASRDVLLNDSVKLLKKFVQGKPVGVQIDKETGKAIPGSGVKPKCSTMVRCAEMILDREVPKVALSASITADLTEIVDLNGYE